MIRSHQFSHLKDGITVFASVALYSRYIVGRGPEKAYFSSSSLTARPLPYTSILVTIGRCNLERLRGGSKFQVYIAQHEKEAKTAYFSNSSLMAKPIFSNKNGFLIYVPAPSLRTSLTRPVSENPLAINAFCPGCSSRIFL